MRISVNDEFNGKTYAPKVTGGKVISGLVQLYNNHLMNSTFTFTVDKYITTVAIPSSSATRRVIDEALRSAYDSESYKLRTAKDTLVSFYELSTPLKDGKKERPHDPRFEDCCILNASTKDKPEVVDAYGRPFEGKEVKNGALGRVSFVFSPYYIEKEDKKGYSVRLHNVQILDNAYEEDFTERRSAESDFGDLYLAKKDKDFEEM